MHPVKPSSNLKAISQPAGLLAWFGRAVQRNQKIIACIQWSIVGIYLFLLLAPLFITESNQNIFLFQHIGLIARFAFWGFGWPLIILSMMLFGRVWCGIFCPDGTLTETASRYGQKRSIPRWIRWNGWPFLMLTVTTIYAQLSNAYHFHPATLALLGIPSLAAILTGFLYGNGRRIWCMYLCPANGVFSLLAKISPLHFHVDKNKWEQYSGSPQRMNCPTLIDIKRMQSTSACHACFQCSGYRNAVDLSVRTPGSEIVSNEVVRHTEAFMLLFGIIGICTSALIWSKSALYLYFRYLIADWLFLQNTEPNLTLTSALLFIVFTGMVLGMLIFAFIWLSARMASDSEITWQRLTMGLIPIAGIGVFLGISTVGINLMKSVGFIFAWIPATQTVLLTIGSLFSAWLGIRLILNRITLHRIFSFLVYTIPILLLHLLWHKQLLP